MSRAARRSTHSAGCAVAVADLPYLRVAGHAEVKRILADAGRAGRLPQSLLLFGPRGVGKQRLALWLAALVQCERDGHEPCGACRSCGLAGRLMHPDIHWFFPTGRPHTTSADKARERMEELRAEELQERRANPRYSRAAQGPTGIYVAAAQNLRALAAGRPSMGRRTVAIIGDAETLVPQEGSAEAANALLKILEEPPSAALLVLTTAVPGALLPTIRSRCLGLRVPPLPHDDVARFLQDELGHDAAEARLLAQRSQGSIGRALQLLDDDARQLRQDAEELLQAAVSPAPARRLETAHHFGAFGARGTFLHTLDELQARLRDRMAEERTAAAGSLAGAVLAVEDARGMAERNVNPQLIVAGLLRRLNILLSVPGAPGPRAETPRDRS